MSIRCLSVHGRSGRATGSARIVVIRRLRYGFVDAECSAAAWLARTLRVASRACWAARWRVLWAAVVTVAAVVMLAAAVWLAASVAVPAHKASHSGGAALMPDARWVADAAGREIVAKPKTSASLSLSLSVPPGTRRLQARRAGISAMALAAGTTNGRRARPLARMRVA
jgi:hypothetical protein